MKGSRATAEVRAGHKKADSRAGINCSIFVNRWGRSNKQGKLGEAGGQEALLELVAEPARGDWAQSQTGYPWGGQGGGMCRTSAGRRGSGICGGSCLLSLFSVKE